MVRVTHPFHPLELAARVRNLLRMKAMQDQLRAFGARMETLAITDDLTGISNRRRFLDQMAWEYSAGELLRAYEVLCGPNRSR